MLFERCPRRASAAVWAAIAAAMLGVVGGATATAEAQSFRIRVVNVDGTGGHAVAGAAMAFGPAWSRDGGRIAFLGIEQRPADQGDALQIFLVNADGSGLAQLTQLAGDDKAGIAWSPDGRQIAYVDARGGGFHVYTIRPDGRGRRRVGNRSCILNPDWRPDGKRLACAGLFRRAGRWRLGINVVGIGGRIRRSLPPDGAPVGVDSPTWSPDDTKLTYLRERHGRPALYVIGADGRGNRLLSARPGVLAPVYPVSWSPDSTRIAFGTGQLPD